MNDDCELVNRANWDRIFIITFSQILSIRPQFENNKNGFMDKNMKSMQGIPQSLQTHSRIEESFTQMNVWK